MSAWSSLLATEVRVQYRGGLYAAYAAMTAFFFTLLLLVPPELRPQTFELIVLLDPAFMGFFFAGGLVLLERDQGILALIVTHGQGFRSWWRAKATAVMVLAAAVVTILTLLAHGMGLVRMTAGGILFIATGLFLSVPLFFSLGVVLAARYARILDYFIYSGIVMVPFMIPLVEVAGVSLGPVGALSPVWGGMVLLTSIFEPARSAPEIAGAVASLLVWNVLAYRWARRAFGRLAAGQHRKPGGVPRRPVRRDRPSGTGIRVAADVTLLLRDPMTRLILVAPLLAAFVLGRGVPIVLGRLAGAPAVLAPAILAHMDAIRSFAIILAAVMYGMAGAFLILDEKDEGLLPLLKTMPGRPGWYVLRRGATLMVLFGLLLLALVPVGGLAHGTTPVFIASLLVDSMTVILTYLAMSILARNKVQGLAMAKVLNVCSLPPLLLIALPGRAGFLVGLFPSGWGSLMRLRAGTPQEALFLGVAGLLYSAVIMALLYRRVLEVD